MHSPATAQASPEQTQDEINRRFAEIAAQNRIVAELTDSAIEAAAQAKYPEETTVVEGLDNILADGPETKGFGAGWMNLLAGDSSDDPINHEPTFEERVAGQSVVELTPERNRANSLQVARIAERMSHVRAWEIRRSESENDSNNIRKGKGSLFKRALALITGTPQGKHQPGVPTERQLIELESKIGGKLLGSIPAGHTRDFFCLDDKTWVWHEGWKDNDKHPQSQMIRYEVQPAGILKVQPGRVYKYIEGEELEDLAVATRMYYEQTMHEVYELDTTTGQPLTATPPATIYR